MNRQEIQALAPLVRSRLNPGSPTCLDDLEPERSSAGRLQRELIGTATALLAQAHRWLDQPAHVPQVADLPEGFEETDLILADVDLANDWCNFAEKVRALREALSNTTADGSVSAR